MGLLKLDAGDLLLCMRRLCKSLRISANSGSIAIELKKLLSLVESMSEKSYPDRCALCVSVKGVLINIFLSDSNLVDSASSIRLSQRLSHACLSINNFIRETANGSLYQL